MGRHPRLPQGLSATWDPKWYNMSSLDTENAMLLLPSIVVLQAFTASRFNMKSYYIKRFGSEARSRKRVSGEGSRRASFSMHSLCDPCQSWNRLSAQELEDDDEPVEVPCMMRLPSLQPTSRPVTHSSSPVSPPMRCSYPRNILSATEASATTSSHPASLPGNDRYISRPLSPIMEEVDNTRLSMLYMHYFSDQFSPATYSQNGPPDNLPTSKGLSAVTGPYAESEVLSELKQRLSAHDKSDIDIHVRSF
jgi:hypothetical protein